MGVSPRHTRRLLAAYRRDGAAALAHGNREGRRPANATPDPLATDAGGPGAVGPGADPIRGSQPHAPERAAEGARGHRHRT